MQWDTVALFSPALSLSPTQHTNDFALYTEAIKFFNHPESMVRIAVRTITLNVYKGEWSRNTHVHACNIQAVHTQPGRLALMGPSFGLISPAMVVAEKL